MAWMADDAYRIMLAAAALLIAGTLVCAWRTDFNAFPVQREAFPGKGAALDTPSHSPVAE
jgi:hypothetical protein